MEFAANETLVTLTESLANISHPNASDTWDIGNVTDLLAEGVNFTDGIFLNNETVARVIPNWQRISAKILAIAMPITNVIMMLAMGCLVEWRQLLRNMWPPIGIVTGLCGQFVLLPAIAFGFTTLFQLTPYQSLGTLIVSSCPGGAFSNFFVHWVDGDLELSIVMTTCSTLIALLMMPLNIWIYSPYIVPNGTTAIVVPYGSMLKSLGMAVGPVFIGMVLRHFKVELADKLGKVMKLISYVAITLCVALIMVANIDVLLNAHILIYVMATSLPVAGFTAAYIFAFILKMPHKICRTIGIETGCQNMPIAVGVILLSFTDIQILGQLLLVPTIYGNLMIVEMIIGSYIYKALLRRFVKKEDIEMKDGLKYSKAETEDVQDVEMDRLVAKN